jgi:poly(hydroxyalkanoate) depolymerase family esterase
VVVLHGCRQDNRDIETITGFNELADRHGFLVAYPFITSYRGLRNRNCWGWWFEREIHAGAGEVEDLWQIIEEIKLHYPVDPRRIHVSGLSSGAGMAVAMMVAHADKIASGAAVAGVPYAEKADAVRHELNREPRNRPVVAIVSAMQEEMGAAARAVPIQIVHSKNDDKVDINSAKVLRDSWGHCFGIDTRRAFKKYAGQDRGTRWEHSEYRNDGGKSVIETLFLQGPGHGWYGGNPGDFSFPEGRLRFGRCSGDCERGGHHRCQVYRGVQDEGQHDGACSVAHHPEREADNENTEHPEVFILDMNDRPQQ